MNVPTYQELLAEQYEDNAKNLLVFQKQYENEDDDEGDIDYHEDQDYSQYQLNDPDKFNEFQGDRNTAKFITETNPFEDKTRGSVRYNKDVKTHIVDIDTRFRAFGNGQIPLKMGVTGSSEASSTLIAPTSNVANFAFGLPRLLKNVISMKITSISFPNTFWTYQSSRNNITFKVYNDYNRQFDITKQTPPYDSYWFEGITAAECKFVLGTVTITEGNYSTVDDFMTELNVQLAKVPSETSLLEPTPNYPFKAQYDSRTNKTRIYRDDPGTTTHYQFGLNFAPPTPELLNTGLGYYMGYQNFFYGTAPPTDPNIIDINLTQDSSHNYQCIAESFPMELLGESYIYLSINEIDIIEHQSFKQSFLPVFAKLLLPEASKNKRITDINLLNVVQREYNFLQPVNMQKLLITLYDRYGNIIDMQNTNYSFTMMFEEVLNPGMYEKLREL